MLIVLAFACSFALSENFLFKNVLNYTNDTFCFFLLLSVTKMHAILTDIECTSEWRKRVSLVDGSVFVQPLQRKLEIKQSSRTFTTASDFLDYF